MNDKRVFLMEGRRLTLAELVKEVACRLAGRKAVLVASRLASVQGVHHG